MSLSQRWNNSVLCSCKESLQPSHRAARSWGLRPEVTWLTDAISAPSLSDETWWVTSTENTSVFVRNITCSVVFSPVLCSVHLLCFALLFSVPLPPHLFCSQCFSMLLICSVFFSADLFSVFIFSVFICSLFSSVLCTHLLSSAIVCPCHLFSVLLSCSPSSSSVLFICSPHWFSLLHIHPRFSSPVSVTVRSSKWFEGNKFV